MRDRIIPAPQPTTGANLERQVLEVALQLPQFLDIDEFDALPADSFSVSAYRAVHDAIRATGGLHTAQELGVSDQEAGVKRWADAVRQAEEHTSELQSRGHLVCRLLLENKKNHE